MLLFKSPFDSTVRDQPLKLEKLLKIITEHPDLFDREALQEYFLTAIRSDWAVFMIGALGVDLSQLKLLSRYPDWLDHVGLQAVFIDEIDKQNALQLFASHNLERLEILLKFMKEYSHLFEKETIKQLFLRKGGYNTFSALQTAAYHQPKALKPLLNFLEQHPDLIENQDLQEMLLQKTVNGNLLELAVRCTAAYSIPDPGYSTIYQDPQASEDNLEGLYALLKFFDEQSDRINQSTIQQLFHPVEDLFELIALKPVALKTVIKLLMKHPDWIDKKDLQRMFLKKGSLNKTAYSLSYHSETTKDFVELIIQLASFDQKTLKHIFSKNDAHLNVFIIEKVLVKYLEELEDRKENNITHTTRFFNHNFGYSTQEKKTAALALEALFKEPHSFNSENLLHLRQSHPALGNGRLGQLFSYCESTTKNDNIEIRSFSMT